MFGGLSLDEQYDLVEEIQEKFDAIDRLWGHLPDYDGEYGVLSAGLQDVLESLYRLRGLEK